MAGERFGNSQRPESCKRAVADAFVDNSGVRAGGMGHASFPGQPEVAKMLNRSMHPGDSGAVTRPKPSRPGSSANLRNIPYDR